MLNIDYYCFPSKTGDISVFTDLDQYTNWDEKIHYATTREDVLLAKEKGKLLLFDLRNNLFVDENGKEVDISGKVIFPRSTIQEANLLMEHIEKHQGNSITTRKDYDIVTNWFRFIQTKRKFKMTTRRELEQNLDKYEAQYGKSIFVKTIDKGFSDICHIYELGTENDKRKTLGVFRNGFIRSLGVYINDSETPVLIYEALKVLKDEFGKREWRAFVVGNELLCLSRVSDDVVPIEASIYKKVKKKIKEFEGKIPSSYVVDFFEYEEESGNVVFDVCECNPIIASGVFQNNDLVI